MVWGILGLMLSAGLIIKLSPDVWWKEMLVITVSGISSFLIITRIFKSAKWGAIITIACFGLLIFNRFGVLDLLTIALLIIIMGLISLIY